MNSQLSNPEFELLIKVSRSESNLSDFITNHQIDWEYLLLLASSQGMLPLLHLGLKKTRQELVPKKVTSQLKDIYLETTQANLLLLSELVQLLRLLKTEGIEVVPFKGVHLSKTLYDSYSIRHAGDIDILAKPDDVLFIAEMLQQRGYDMRTPFSKQQQLAILSTSRENRFNLANRNKNLIVELHWQVFTSDLIGRQETAFIWENLEETVLQNEDVKVFKPEVMMMYLCFHAFKHNWSRISFLRDIDYYLRKYPNLDWLWILDHADNLGGEIVMLLSLALTERLLGTDLPQMIIKRTEQNQHLQKVLGRINLTPERFQLEVERALDVRSLRDQFTIQSSRPARIRQFIRWAIIPNHFDIIAADLPPALHFLYYLLRPFRLLGRGIKRMISSN